MAVFEFEDDDSTDNTEQSVEETVKITGNGPADCKSFRMSIPKSIADNQDVSVGDMARVSPTDSGFEVEILDI